MEHYGASFAKYYDLMYSWKDYAKESGVLRELIAQHGNGGVRVLEAACGTGLYIQQLHGTFTVTGLDQSKEMLAIAAQKVPNVKLVQSDMSHFSLNEKFDVVLCLFSSIAYMKNREELRKAIACFYDHLAPGGIAIVEPFIDPDKVINGLPHALNVNRDDVKLSRHNVTRVSGDKCELEMHTLVTTSAGVEYFVEHHDMTLFHPHDMIADMESAGFTVTRLESGLMPNRSLFVGKKSV